MPTVLHKFSRDASDYVKNFPKIAGILSQSETNANRFTQIAETEYIEKYNTVQVRIRTETENLITGEVSGYDLHTFNLEELRALVLFMNHLDSETED